MIFNRSIKGQLDKHLKKNYQQILDLYQFELIEKKIQGLLAIYSYQNDVILIRLINDKGIVNSTISSVYGKGDFYDLDVINVLLKTKRRIDMNEEALKYYLTRSMTPSKEVELLKNNMALIRELFEKNNFEKTQKELSEIGWKRAEFLFGKDFQENKDI